MLATKATAISRRTGERVVGHLAARLLAALDALAARLGTDHVDLWQVHAWTTVTPLEETLAALDTAVTSGRVRYAGVSNYSRLAARAPAATWQEAWPGPRAARLDADGVLPAPARHRARGGARGRGARASACCRGRRSGAGVLTGKYRSGTPADSRGRVAALRRVRRAATSTTAAAASSTRWLTAADGLGVSPLAVALAWVRDRPGVIAPIVGARTAAQLRASLAAEAVTLPAEIRAALDEVSAPPTGYPDG